MTAKEAIKNIKGLLDGCCGPELDDTREAVWMAIKALEKQIPKKPTKQTDEWSQSLYNLRCPQCNAVVAMGNSRVGYCDRINKGYEICRACGQTIDFTEGEG